MRDQLERRLKELSAEFEAGQKILADLEARQASVRETLLRISGAIQVLQEELAKVGQLASPGIAEDRSDGRASVRLPENPGNKAQP